MRLKTSKNIIFTITTILVVISVFITGYFVYKKKILDKSENPIPTPTIIESNFSNNWKTYTNEPYKYSVNYPEDYEPKEAIDSGTILDLVSFNKKIDDDPLFSVEVYKSDLDKTTEYVKALYPLSTYKVISETEKIPNYPNSLILEYKSEEENFSRRNYIINSGEYSYILYTKSENGDQILSTFKLTD